MLLAIVLAMSGVIQGNLELPVHQMHWWDPNGDISPRLNVSDCGSNPPQIGACQLPAGLTDAEVQTRLGGKDTAWWREGDAFVVVAKRSEGPVELCCAARGKMEHVGGDYYAIRLRVADLDEATIDVIIPPKGTVTGAYRGPKAPPKPEMSEPLKGQLLQFAADSKVLDDPRQVTVYLPPGYDAAKTYPVVYMADGVWRQDDPKAVEALILNKEIPPIILVEIWPGISRKDIEFRSREYLYDWHGNSGGYFLKHETFLLKELLPAIQTRFHASALPEDRLINGFSSGASWAVSMGVRHPETFPYVSAQSVGWSGSEKGLDQPGNTAFFLSAGTMEPDFYKETIKTADIARASGHDVTLRIEVSGHTNTIFREMLLESIKWWMARRAAAHHPPA